ncbi:MAG TPA: efflux RND transporter permease subunit [Terriglobia bacterium]|nr:efflux RND transporter permease subunit [Terriglobia bacterium]
MKAEDLEVRDQEQAPESSYWITRHSKSIVFLILVLAAVGVYLAFSIPVSVFPETNFPRIIVGVDNGVMPINQMEVSITRVIEEAVNGVPGLQEVQSTTSRGSAEVDLYFDWNADMVRTLQQVDAAVSRAQSQLPPGAQITSNRLSFASFPIIGYSLTSDRVSQQQLWEISTYEIKPRLNRLNGVAQVLVQGGDQPEFQITPDPSALLRAKVTVPDILDAIRRSNLIDSPGLLPHSHQLFLGLVSAQAQDPGEIGRIVVKDTVAGAPVRIEDIGAVTPSVTPVYTVVTANGKPATLISVNRQPTSNTVAVADEVHSEMQQIERSLPSGVQVSTFYDQSALVVDSIRSVRDAILIGLILASIILLLFLRDWGTSLVAGLVIPITVVVTFIALKLLGQSFNLMTLGGLAAAVGLVIDDAIVVVENIVLHRDAGESHMEAIHSALGEISIPLVGSTVTPVVVFLPLITITGVEGTFFRALAVTMSVSLFTSLALALAWTPNLSRYFIRRKAGSAQPVLEPAGIPDDPAPDQISDEIKRLMAAEEASMKGAFSKVIRVYEVWVRRALEHPAWLGIFCAILIAVSYICYRSLGTDLLPAMDEGGFIMDYLTPPGSSLEETDRIVSHFERIIRALPEVESTSRRTGMQLGLATVTEANNGDIAVKLKAKRERGIEEIISEVRSKATQAEPECDIDFHQMLEDMIGDLTGAPQPIQIKLFNPNGDLLNQWAPQIADAIGKVQVGGKKVVVDLANGVDNTLSGPAVLFQVNPEAAARAGFTPEEITTDAAALLEGEPTPTPVILNDRPYTLRVRFPQANRASLEAMQNTMLVSSSGATGTLGSLAAVSELPGQTEITRDNLQREVAVTARLEGTDLGTGIAAVKKAVDALHPPGSIRVEYGGTYKEQQKAFRDFATVLVLALVLVFLVLLFEFGQFSAPAAILSSAVLSTSGVFFALLITGTTFNISSFMGLIMVIGIVAKNGILLLDADQKFRAAGFSPEEAMVQAGRRRLRPIVMTALAAVAGMLPLALALGAGSQMLQPLAIAVIGGITISMVLSLIITPAMQFYLTRSRA